MKYLNYTFRFIIFWLIFFLVNRIIFALYFIDEIKLVSFVEILTILPKSIPLDVSFISYLLVLIVVLIWINSFLKKQGFISFIGHPNYKKYKSSHKSKIVNVCCDAWDFKPIDLTKLTTLYNDPDLLND